MDAGWWLPGSGNKSDIRSIKERSLCGYYLLQLMRGIWKLLLAFPGVFCGGENCETF